MDIWSWVQDAEDKLYEDGHERLAWIMQNIPNRTVDDKHDEVDALYAEGIGLARAHPNKWIEVFLRHWHLQSQVLHRYNSRGNLSEAIDLLDFSHRADTRDCPQSICAVQDLANCYGVRDGPGFVPERVEVCLETLQRINPKWPCYKCIASELLDAYVDAGDIDKALESLHEFRAELLKVGEKTDGIMNLTEADCYRRLGEFDKAEAVARAATGEYSGASFVAKKSLLLAAILADQKRFDEARERLLPFDDIVETMSRYRHWHEATYALACADPEQNTGQVEYDFSYLFGRAIGNGAIRLALSLAGRRTELALRRRDAFTAQHALKQFESALPELNKDMGAQAEADALAARVRTLVTERTGEPNVVTLQDIVGDGDSNDDGPQPDLFDLSRLYLAHPDEPRVAMSYGDALSRFAYLEQSVELYREFLDRHPDATTIASRYGHGLLDQNRLEEFDRRFGAVDVTTLADSAAFTFHWVSARRWHTPDASKALHHLNALLAIKPDSRNALNNAAALERERGNLAISLDYYERLIDVAENPNDAHWDRMVAATLAERWDLVRASCAVLDMKLSTEEGPIVEQWGVVRIRFVDGDSKITLRARRTGPVTARIIDLRPLEDTQYYDHHIVFDAYPLNKLDQKDEEGDAHDSEGYYTYLYDAVDRKSGPGYFYFSLDGVFPGQERWDALVQTLNNRGLIVSRRSSEEYRLQNPETDVEEIGIYALVGVPETQSLSTVQTLLIAETATLAHPLIWPHLATELADSAMLQTQADIEARYGIT